MANRRAIVKRRKAVRNIKKITRTMQLIATARFQAAMNRATASRPYVDKLAEMVGDLTRVTGELRHPLMESHGGEDRSALVVITSNRGLCGGYNWNVLRAALDHLIKEEAAGVATEIHMVGKKGISALRFRGRAMASGSTAIDDKPRYDQIEPLARKLAEGFLEGHFASVYVAYMRFYSAGRQRPEVFRLLPLSREAERSAVPGRPKDRSYDPNPRNRASKVEKAILELVYKEFKSRLEALKSAQRPQFDLEMLRLLRIPPATMKEKLGSPSPLLEEIEKLLDRGIEPEMPLLSGEARLDLIKMVEDAAQAAEDYEEESGPVPQYEILPSPEELLDRLLPATARMRLYQAFLDAAVSEQIARMTAMKAATEAADETIGTLTRQYNRARQTQITMELLDIVGGANALA